MVCSTVSVELVDVQVIELMEAELKTDYNNPDIWAQLGHAHYVMNSESSLAAALAAFGDEVILLIRHGETDQELSLIHI